MNNINKKTIVKEIDRKLKLNFGIERSEATSTQIFKACALMLRDMMSGRRVHTGEKHKDTRQVHYLSLEFLIGRSLEKNAFNLGILGELTEALGSMGYNASDIFEEEPDAGLGNGGLGRLAACYLESMTTLDMAATGYSICYELGIFRQKIVDGEQVEVADDWLVKGESWLMPKIDETVEIHFGGKIDAGWDESGNHYVNHHGYTTVLAVPKDILIAGYDTSRVNKLRLWDAKSPDSLDMSLFSKGEYMKAMENRAMAEVITKILYPEDNHVEGKSLRLKQQYFFVSATIQSIVAQHRAAFGSVKSFHKNNIIQINDTHPALVIPELMHIFVDEDGLGWDEAWAIVTKSVAYTNHTVLAEALECWPQDLFERQLPRIWSIMCEINDRYCRKLTEEFNGDIGKVSKMAIIWDHQVRMANLCICACCAVNGVSHLHTEILKSDIFADAYKMEPKKFTNVTNGIDHRRWLAQSNPELHDFIVELTGSDEYLKKPLELEKLERFKSEKKELTALANIKHDNKERLAEHVLRDTGIILNTDAIFDVQVKRLHEYKRQLMNAMHICHLYITLKDNPNMDFVPRTFIFGAKAAPGYTVAKQIIKLICSLSDEIMKDPICKDRLQLVFLENYRVSMAEVLIPASEVSEQISTAGKEASGTGNMKFMMNGALTVGTLDGANVEMHNVLGDDNMFLFGLTEDQVTNMKAQVYNPSQYYNGNEGIRRVIDHITSNLGSGTFSGLMNSLLFGSGGEADPYMLLADFESYRQAHKRIAATYPDKMKWNQMSLTNIARSGIFAADRSIKEYADNIWHVPYRKM